RDVLIAAVIAPATNLVPRHVPSSCTCAVESHLTMALKAAVNGPRVTTRGRLTPSRPRADACPDTRDFIRNKVFRTIIILCGRYRTQKSQGKRPIEPNGHSVLPHRKLIPDNV